VCVCVCVHACVRACVCVIVHVWKSHFVPLVEICNEIKFE
jgi:hypothetical protein